MPRVPKAPAVPLSSIEVSEPPPMTRSAKKEDRWAKFARVMEDVRGLAGRSAKICHHPDAKQLVVTLRQKHPEFVFTSRTIQVGGKETTGVWARLNVEPVANPVPELPSELPLTDPV